MSSFEKGIGVGDSKRMVLLDLYLPVEVSLHKRWVTVQSSVLIELFEAQSEKEEWAGSLHDGGTKENGSSKLSNKCVFNTRLKYSLTER